MSVAKAVALFAVILPLLAVQCGCGGVTTTATVDQPVGSLNLAADTSTGAADGYVYIPVSLSRQAIDIVISADSTPPSTDYEAADSVTVEIKLSGNVIATAQTNSLGYYALLRLAPGTYDLVVTADGTTVTRPIEIQADSTTHADQPPTLDHPFAGFTQKQVDLSGNSTWQQIQDRIEGIDDIQFSFSAINETGAEGMLDVFVSQNASLTAVTIDDATADVPPAYQLYSFSLEAGGPLLISSNPANTIEENQQEFRNQVLSGSFYLYARVQPPQGESFTISNVELRLRLRIQVL